MKLHRNMIVTGADLRTAGACSAQANRVDKLWPEGAALTLANMLTAAREGLDLEWLVGQLPPPARRAYREAVAPAQRAYHEAIAAAWRAYDEAVAPAQRAYNEAVAPAPRAYREAVAPALRVYREALAAAWRAYNETADAALWAALPEEGV